MRKISKRQKENKEVYVRVLKKKFREVMRGNNLRRHEHLQLNSMATK